jgi:hypothetical protein
MKQVYIGQIVAIKSFTSNCFIHLPWELAPLQANLLIQVEKCVVIMVFGYSPLVHDVIKIFTFIFKQC